MNPRTTRSLIVAGLGGLAVAACAQLPLGSHSPAGSTLQQGSPGASADQIQGSEIQGTVHVQGGQSASGLDVTAYPAGSQPGSSVYASRTDTQGHFAIPVPAGVYNLVVQDPGTPFRAIKWSVQSATSVSIDLVPTGSIAGTVTASPSLDLTGVQVFVPGTDIFGTTDAGGNYQLDNVPIGSYALTVVDPKAGQFTGNAPLWGQVATLSVTAGAVTTASPVTLAPLQSAPGTLKGDVFVPDATDSSGIAVTITQSDGSTISALTDVQGNFQFGNVAAGLDQIAYSKLGYAFVANAGTYRVWPKQTTTAPAFMLKPDRINLALDTSCDPVPPLTLLEGTTMGLRLCTQFPQPYPTSSFAYNWTSSNPSVLATLDGGLDAISTGSAIITVTGRSDPNAVATMSIAVSDQPAKFVLQSLNFLSNGDHFAVLLNHGGSSGNDTLNFLYNDTSTQNNFQFPLSEVPPGATVSVLMNNQNQPLPNTDIYPGINLGVQAAGGALQVSETQGNLVDFIEWGAPPVTPYPTEAQAVTDGLWASGTFAPVATSGDVLHILTPGATGSSNWKLN